MVKLFSGGEAPKKKEEGSLLSGVGTYMADKTTPNKSLCPKLSLRTRVKGWFILLCIGMVVSLLGAGLIKSILKGDILKFGIIYTVGTMCSLGSSLFLWGPASQCKSMFDKKRRITTCVFLSCIVGTICCLLFYPQPQLIFALVITQYCAYFWYSLSFIPFGRTIFCKCFKKTVGDLDE